jgi:hypothetical protein
MSKLKNYFTDKEWKNCCGGFCSDCKIAVSYKNKFGKKDGQKKFDKDKKKQ